MLLKKNLRRKAIMPEKSMEEKIKDILRVGQFSKGFAPTSRECPKNEDLADYISGAAGQHKKEKIATHISHCRRCLDIAATSLKTLNEDKAEDVPKGIIQKTTLIPKNYPKKNIRGISVFRKNKYLLVASVFFVLSFILKRYFMQFLFAAGIFGVKWVMDTGSTKALIMIYDAWKSRKDNDDDDSNISSKYDSRLQIKSKNSNRNI